MQALRKPSADMAGSPGPTAVRSEAKAPQLAGDRAATLSPALALRDHLAARLEDIALGTASHAATAEEPVVYKLPMAARMVVIVGLSLSLWLALYAVIAALL